MKRTLALLTTAALSAPLMASDHAMERQLNEHIDTSRATIQQFAQTLQGELQAAVREGGAPAGIRVCNDVAPAIAEQASEDFNGDVGRTSLKIRNAANSPDDWEAEVLARFDERRAAGQDPSTIDHFEVHKTADGGREFRYMRAIPAGEVCMACHGTSIDDGIKATLNEYYPDDKATGYQPGQLRGAFTLRREF